MAVLTLCQYIRDQWPALPPVEPVGDISAKTFIVTGSNVGLGFEASLILARMEPKRLIATSRDAGKCAGTLKAIIDRAAVEGVQSPRVAAWPLNMDTFDDVRAFADRFAAEGGELHALVANAGLYRDTYAQTQDGWEVMLQVDYLSTALLSVLLLPCLVSAATPESPSRLVIVSSLGHYLGPYSLRGFESWTDVLDTVNDRQFGLSVERYSVTKLLEVLFIRELAARLPHPSPVVVCAVNPGYCHSSLFRTLESKWYLRWLMPAIRVALLARPTAEGAKTLVHPAISGVDDARAMHGRYLSACQVTEESDFVFTPQGKAFSVKLWDETIALLSHVDDRVAEIVAKYLRTDA